MTGPADITGAHPDVDALVETVRGALSHLRYSNLQPNLGAAWDAKDARAALSALAALARDAAEAKQILREMQHAGDEPLADTAQVTLDSLHHAQHSRESVVAERDRLARRVGELERALEDFATHGTRYDCNPTVMVYGDNQQWMECHAWWVSRAHGMDNSVRERARAVLAASTGPGCDHEWVDASNEAVESGEICVKCHAIRAASTGPEGTAE